MIPGREGPSNPMSAELSIQTAGELAPRPLNHWQRLFALEVRQQRCARLTINQCPAKAFRATQELALTDSRPSTLLARAQPLAAGILAASSQQRLNQYA